MLFVSAKYLNWRCCRKVNRSAISAAVAMVDQMDEEGFGNCTNIGACEAECPKEIKLTNIARMNREYFFLP
jgi:succinate dehydrogenase / fumarate reductase iron-sulfur subunit